MVDKITQSVVIHATSGGLSPQQIVDRLHGSGIHVSMIEIVYPPVELVEVDEEMSSDHAVN